MSVNAPAFWRHVSEHNIFLTRCQWTQQILTRCQRRHRQPLTFLVVPEFGGGRVQRTLVVRFWNEHQHVDTASQSWPPCCPGTPSSSSSSSGATQRRFNLVTSQQALDGQQDAANVVERRPLVLQDVEADETLSVHVGMKTRRDELHARRLIRVTGGKLQRQPVPETLVHLKHAQVNVYKSITSHHVSPWGHRMPGVYSAALTSHDYQPIAALRAYVPSPERRRWSRSIWRDCPILETPRSPYRPTSAATTRRGHAVSSPRWMTSRVIRDGYRLGFFRYRC